MRIKYPMADRAELKAAFIRLLPQFDLEHLYDGELTAIYGCIKINIDTLERQIMEMYPNEYRTCSMEEIIRKHNGDSAAELIKAIL